VAHQSSDQERTGNDKLMEHGSDDDQGWGWGGSASVKVGEGGSGHSPSNATSTALKHAKGGHLLPKSFPG
jgi:hypothetical protein